MSWRDKLRPASFRGVPFQVDGEKTPVGRRTVLHEYPQRDVPFAEDMGRRTRQYTLTAFLIGADCLEQRDALLKALETPGAGELVHPWYGTLKVTAGDCEVSHERLEGGVVRCTLEFVEAGELVFPSGKANTGKQASAAADTVLAAGTGRFDEAMAQINRTRVAASGLVKGMTGLYSTLQQQVRPITDAIGGVDAFIGMLIGAPSQLTGLITGVLANAGGAFNAFSGYRFGLSALSGRVGAVSSLAALPAPQGAEAAELQAAAVALAQDVLLVDMIRQVGEMPANQPAQPLATVPALAVQVQQPVTRAEVPVVDDVQQVQALISDALWEQALQGAHEYYQAVTDARIQVTRHLTEVARQGVRLTTVTPPQPVPAVALAYARYGDASRAEEVVSRNRVVHPLFVPPSSLQVAVS
ncbi:DNA circularization protein [Cupriavidus oxalaticus]|uniref:DNA circulation N-terminal domain-containing protein n=1 Tax=Cupriavidus oxalaticus TaxID=96344 RepID=A0A4P7LJ27_9BURK|nr:DNA circularization N-terminal domain-containing protein [Cupriavidus oxalaticus]QBY56156.1 hypothetical protein E0W60_34430 [Cupriavidus oxalaticus]